MTTIRNFAIRQYKIELAWLHKQQFESNKNFSNEDMKRMNLLEYMIYELEKPEVAAE